MNIVYMFREWNKELKKQRRLESLGQNYQASLTKALVRQFGPIYALLGIIMCIEECCIRVFQPVLMGEYFTLKNTFSDTNLLYHLFI